jgi:hypothetical protein
MSVEDELKHLEFPTAELAIAAALVLGTGVEWQKVLDPATYVSGPELRRKVSLHRAACQRYSELREELER